MYNKQKEKEAMLHIELVRTQPFEDGNKRTYFPNNYSWWIWR